MTIELGTVIAERRLRVAGQPDLDIWVRLGMPRPFDDDASDFYCPYQITGIGSGRVQRAGGVDALQALELAIQVLPKELDVLSRRYPGLRWEDAAAGDFGFSQGGSELEDEVPPQEERG